MTVVIGVDGGGTKTRCLVADQERRTLGEGLAGPSNFRAVGLQTAVANLEQAVTAALQQAGLTLADVSAACFGLAGVGRPEDQAVMTEALSFMGTIPLQVVVDARIALAGALEEEPGAIVIAGTGSIAYGLDAAGETVRAGGWGWILGDEGGGCDIGRQAVKAALAALDGTGPQTSLTERIQTAWGLERIDQVVGQIYPDLTQAKGDLAALAPLVMAAAEEGDQVARRILTEAGQSLATLAATVLDRLALPDPGRVALVGGILLGNQTVRTAMERALLQRRPGVRTAEAAGSPADGAVRMALAR